MAEMDVFFSVQGDICVPKELPAELLVRRAVQRINGGRVRSIIVKNLNPRVKYPHVEVTENGSFVRLLVIFSFRCAPKSGVHTFEHFLKDLSDQNADIRAELTLTVKLSGFISKDEFGLITKSE